MSGVIQGHVLFFTRVDFTGAHLLQILIKASFIHSSINY